MGQPRYAAYGQITTTKTTRTTKHDCSLMVLVVFVAS